jgi:hypothetical protein
MIHVTVKTITLGCPTPEVADLGTVRLGSGSISAAFPPLRLPSPATADRGAVRLGSGSIFGSLPIPIC